MGLHCKFLKLPDPQKTTTKVRRFDEWHSVANGSPPLRRFFERSCVWHFIPHRPLHSDASCLYEVFVTCNSLKTIATDKLYQRIEFYCWMLIYTQSLVWPATRPHYSLNFVFGGLVPSRLPVVVIAGSLCADGNVKIDLISWSMRCTYKRISKRGCIACEASSDVHASARRSCICSIQSRSQSTSESRRISSSAGVSDGMFFIILMMWNVVMSFYIICRLWICCYRPVVVEW